MVLNRIKHSQVRATSRSIKQCNTPAQNTSVVSELGTSNTGITPNAQINSGGHSGEFNPVAPPRVKRCFLCNSPNHIQSFCPQRSNQGYHASAASSIFIMDPTSMLAEKQSTLTWKNELPQSRTSSGRGVELHTGRRLRGYSKIYCTWEGQSWAESHWCRMAQSSRAAVTVLSADRQVQQQQLLWTAS